MSMVFSSNIEKKATRCLIVIVAPGDFQFYTIPVFGYLLF
jgi:hypothetical protein